MTKKILHPKEIESATVQINCGKKTGTAFFILIGENQQVLLTSDHNLPSDTPVKILTASDELHAEILERIPEKDACILVVKNEALKENSFVPLKSSQVAYDERWETYGFPKQRINTGGRYTGTVSRTNQGAAWDVDLDCDQYNKIDDFSGLSGAPLVIDGFVVGIIGYDVAGTLGATSIASVVEVLMKHGIEVEKTADHSIPDSIEKDISTTTPNEEVLQKINDVVQGQIASSYFLVSGTPGSGKTTVAAQLDFEEEGFVICDKFFVKVPEDEAIPTQIRATPEFFMRWVEEVYFRVLHNAPPPKAEKPVHDRIHEIHQGLQQLSMHYQRQGKIGFLIIDGLDDVSKSKVEDYLSVLPVHLPSNVKVIFSCTSKTVLPTSFQSIIDSTKEIKVTPLLIERAEEYLLKYLKGKNLTISQVSTLAHRSEGHPLYLRYLTKFILGIDDFSSIDGWINSIPVIGGEIERYYNKIWEQLNKDSNETWVAATLSRLRIPVD